MFVFNHTLLLMNLSKFMDQTLSLISDLELYFFIAYSDTTQVPVRYMGTAMTLQQVHGSF